MDPFFFEPNTALAVPDRVQRKLYQGAYDLFGVPMGQLASQDRTRTPSLARQAVVLALRHWDHSITLSQLAAAMFRKDHTTALYALEHGQEEYQKVPTFRDRVDIMKARVGVRGKTGAPEENTTDELTWLRSERERLLSANKAMAAILADLQGRVSFANVQLIPGMLRDLTLDREVGGKS